MLVKNTEDVSSKFPKLRASISEQAELILTQNNMESYVPIKGFGWEWQNIWSTKSLSHLLLTSSDRQETLKKQAHSSMTR